MRGQKGFCKTKLKYSCIIDATAKRVLQDETQVYLVYGNPINTYTYG